MAGLAGGVWVCCSSVVGAATTPDAGEFPGSQRQLLSAIQEAFPHDRDGGLSPLRLSPALVFPAEAREYPRWHEDEEEVTRLLASRELTVSPAVKPTFPPPSSMLAPLGTQVEPPLRLAQAMGGAPGGTRKNPQWMAYPDEPTLLRPSRTLTMPGAAGAGRPPVPGTVIVPTVSEETEDIVDGGFVPGSAAAPSATAATTGQAAGEVQPSRGLAGTGWEIPPIRWGGNLGYSIQKSTVSGAESTTSNSSQGVFANLNMASYIYAPWFATVNGRIGITTSNSSSSSDAASSGGDTAGSSNIIGGGDINMFSSSRFPFRAYFDRTDSRVTGTLVAQDYINTRVGLTQNYRAEDNISTSSFMLDRSVVETSLGRKDTVTALTGNYSTQTGIWQHNANARYSLGERDGTNEQATLMGFNTSHNAIFSDTANLGTTINYSDNDIRTSDSVGGLSVNRGRFLQLYSFGSWMPEFEDLDDLPLTLNGGLRYNSQETQFGDSKLSAQTIGGNLSALYRFNNNLTTSLNTAMNQITLSTGESRLLTLVGSNVNYVGDPLSFGNFSYNWNVGGNANWQSGGGEAPATSQFGVLATHALARAYSLDSGHTLSLTYSQSINATSSQSIGSSQSLSNTLSANYGVYSGERFSGSLSGMLSDVNTTGANAQHYTTLNLGVVAQGQLTQQSSLNMNLMFNWSDQSNQTLDAFGLEQTQNTERMTLNGSVNYNHNRFADVRGLRYNLLFVADSRLRDERLFGNVDAQQEKARLSLTNRLDYSIGLLNFRLSLVNSEAGGKKNALLFFQVTRQFGSY